jgi:hypothetical protein
MVPGKSQLLSVWRPGDILSIWLRRLFGRRKEPVHMRSIPIHHDQIAFDRDEDD